MLASIHAPTAIVNYCKIRDALMGATLLERLFNLWIFIKQKKGLAISGEALRLKDRKILLRSRYQY